MHTLKIVTTVLIVILMLIVLLFTRGLTWKKNKPSLVGFSIMEVVYLLSMICMWV